VMIFYAGSEMRAYQEGKMSLMQDAIC